MLWHGFGVLPCPVAERNGIKMKLKRILSLALAGILLLGVIPFTASAGEEITNPFEDVAAADWFYKEVLSVFDEGIMTGKTATVFDPKANISRAEVVTALARFACVDGPDFDGHEVDFDEAISRNASYREFERHAYESACNLLKKG